MHDVEASDGVFSTDTSTTIAATRMRSLRLRSYTDVAPAYIELIRKANLRSLEGEIWKPEKCKLCLTLKDNMYVLLACENHHATITQTVPIMLGWSLIYHGSKSR